MMFPAPVIWSLGMFVSAGWALISTLFHSGARAELAPLAQRELKHLPRSLHELREFRVNFLRHRRRIWLLGRCWNISGSWTLPRLTEQLMASSGRNTWSFYHLPLRSSSLKPIHTERDYWALLVQSSTYKTVLLHHQKHQSSSCLLL